MPDAAPVPIQAARPGQGNRPTVPTPVSHDSRGRTLRGRDLVDARAAELLTTAFQAASVRTESPSNRPLAAAMCAPPPATYEIAPTSPDQ